MEPVSVPAPRGTLEDPEILQNVPGHLIPILEREFDDFKTEAGKYLAGETPEDEFIKFRLKQGVYGQRQPDVQMIRVKLPFGGITPEQMEAFATVVEKYVPLNKGHITTRQNIQMHHIPLPEAEKAIRELGESGLSSREGCGNTVRNVTGDPWAGVAKDELFDLTPYAGAYVRYFVRHPTTQAMPRKIKTSFDGSPRDRAISGIHDIAFRARVQGDRGPWRGPRRGDHGRRRHLDHAARGACPVRVRRARQRRVPADRRGRVQDLRPPGVAARQPRPCPHQGVRRQVRHRRAAQPGRGGDEGRVGRRTRLLGRAPPVPRRRARGRRRRRRRATAAPTATCRSSNASARPTCASRSRRATSQSRPKSRAAT